MTATTRLAYPGTAAAGDVLTAANVNRLPGGWLGYDKITSDVSFSATETDVISITVSVGANRMLRVVAVFGWDQATSSTPDAQFRLKDGSTTFAALRWASGDQAGHLRGHTLVGWLSVSSSGNRTIKLTAQDAAGVTSPKVRASSSFPCTILVEDIGPAPA